MNVLIVTGIFPPDIGGPATYVPVISSELVKRGHKVTVLTLSDTFGYDDGSYSFPVHRIRRSIFKPVRFLLTVMRILQEGRHAQVLYVNGLYLEAVIAKFFLHKPMVQKVVADWAWERASNKGWVKDTFEEFQKSRYCLKVEVLKALRSFCTQRAVTIILPSQYLARWIAQWGVPEDKIKVVYNAVEAVNGVQPAHLAMPPCVKLKVVTIGRLIPLKQIDVLIEAVSRLDDVGLVVVGDGPERERLEELALALNVAQRVYFAGMRSKEATLSFLSACDLFVLNSTHEGFPYVVLEAMSLGLPVVATAVGGVPEIVCDGENGMLIARNANCGLSNALVRLLSSSEERQKLAAGAQNTRKRFQWSAMIDNTEGILKACSFVK
ncbi:MAG TPA: glycosyltransferase family 4 protein [Nitrososphaera sp.]|nr:glycosyltransferase family 4 protein [Nitrososphaera sp.]